MSTGRIEPPAVNAAALSEHPYADFLTSVQKPGRYLGGEEQQILKSHEELACTFVLAFPDIYEIGMSHLGTRILYDLINKEDDLVCERAFSPWVDMEAELRTRNLPLVSLETRTPLSKFDVVGVSLQYELCYTNVLLNLELGGVPYRSDARGETDPIVLAGGPTATHPEPLSDFVDAFLVGEAEEVLPGLLRTIGTLRKQGAPRAEVLAAIAKTTGMYVPSMYVVAEDERTGLQVVTGLSEAGQAAGVELSVQRVFVRDLDAFPFPERFPVPYAEAIFDRASVEVTRGCTEGCRFCQAGIIYRPVRERTPEAIKKAVLGGIEAGGFNETSLTALSTADVSCINPLIKDLVPELAERKVKLGIASLRAYGLDGELLDQIKTVGISGLTFAPEAGTQRMRDVINKNVTEEDIVTSATRIFERGYDRMKMYFIMGLPTETEEDVVGIIETGRRVKAIAREVGMNRPPAITVSVSQHVPKPHTPFQWAAMDTMEDLRTKVTMLRGLAKQAKLTLKTHTVEDSWLECLFARGDRKLGKALELAYEAGARFDGWQEVFSFDRWLDALEGAGVDPTVYTRTLPVDARLPWDHIDIGLEPGFLASEYQKATRSRLSPPCGKAAGDKVHHTNLPDAVSDQRKLVCYDCGIACDMSEMRDERIVALRGLRSSRKTHDAPEPEVAASSDLVPAEALVGRLATSNLEDGNAWKANAEAAHSRLRLIFGKQGPLRFLSHRDLLRILPRMFRRAEVDLAFSRGYNPIPRMIFSPALALGMAAEEEVVDIDVLLPRSREDLAGLLSDEERTAMGDDLVQRIRDAAPPGLVIVSGTLLLPDAVKLPKLIEAADYAVSLEPDQLAVAAETVARRLAEGELTVQRAVHKKKRGGKRRPIRPGETPLEKTIDIREYLMDASVQDGALTFRLRVGNDGGVRPREVVEALLQTHVADHRMRRTRLLRRSGDTLVGFASA